MQFASRSRINEYDLAGLLMVLILAKLAGMKSLLGVSDWGAIKGSDCEHACNCLGTRCHYKYALARLQSQEVNELFRDWFVRLETESRCGSEPSRLATQSPGRGKHLAIDGKVLKGTGKQAYGGEQPQKHVLHVYEVQTGIVLHQCPIQEKQNEVSALKPLLTEVLCKGRILTTDAIQNYYEFGRLVRRAGGEVIV